LTRKIFIFNNAWLSRTGISGSDLRAVQWSKQWRKMGFETIIFCSSNCRKNHERYGSKAKFVITSNLEDNFPSIMLNNTLLALKNCLNVPKARDKDIIYSSSDFLADSLPAFFMKMQNKKAKWVSGMHLIGKNATHYASQQITNQLLKKADLVMVSNELDKQSIVKKGFKQGKILVTYGAVDKPEKIRKSRQEFDACFIGRLHPQKGLQDLVRIWKNVCLKKPNAKLALIGEKVMLDALKQEIENSGIQKNIEFLGTLNGERKFSALKSSKVLLFPSHYESFGIVALEAMSVATPVIAYDLEIFEKIYPKGMVKAKRWNEKEFANQALKLIENKSLRKKISKEALENSKRFGWEKTAKEIIERLK